MRTKAEIEAQLEAHEADLERFEERAAAYVAGSLVEEEAHAADVEAFREKHAVTTAALKAELGA